MWMGIDLYRVAVESGLLATKNVPRPPALTLPAYRPDGTLAQLMRAIMFPNSNIIFDVQTNDPTRKRKDPDPADGHRGKR